MQRRIDGARKRNGEIKERVEQDGDSNTNDNQKSNSIRIGKDRTERCAPNVSITGTGNEKKRATRVRYRKRDTAAG